MAEYLDFDPSTEPNYYFLSYCSEDADRIKEEGIFRNITNNGVPIWYDYGIPLGSSWESVIGKKISKCKAVIILISKKSIKKSNNSYYLREYTISKLRNKDIYIVLLDKIATEDVPDEMLSWWTEVMQLQNIESFNYNNTTSLTQELTKMLKPNTDNTIEDVLNKYNPDLLTLDFFNSLSKDTRSAALNTINKIIENLNNAYEDHIIIREKIEKEAMEQYAKLSYANNDKNDKYFAFYIYETEIKPPSMYEKSWNHFPIEISKSVVENIDNSEYIKLCNIILQKYRETSSEIKSIYDPLKHFKDKFDKSLDEEGIDFLNSIANTDFSQKKDLFGKMLKSNHSRDISYKEFYNFIKYLGKMIIATA